MSARILETNSTPLARVDVDSVTVDIIENALRNARVEMDAVLFRTAMSPGIREQGDCFPMIANRAGKMVVGQFGSFIHGFKSSGDSAQITLIVANWISCHLLSLESQKLSKHLRLFETLIVTIRW